MDGKETINMGRPRNAAAATADAAAIEAAKAAEAKAANIEAAKVALDAANAEVTARAAELAAAEDAAKTATDTAAAATALTAAEDALVTAKAAAAEAQLKLEALTEADADAAAEDAPPILFDASETGHDLAGLTGMIQNGATLIFGGGGVSLPAVPVQTTRAADWTVTGGRLEFSGEFTILMPNEGVPVTADAVALADGPDGPIRSVAALGGAVPFSPGSEYKFAAGAFVFEGAAA
jgi:hypothetical protein